MDDEGAGSAGSHLEEGGESTPPPASHSMDRHPLRLASCLAPRVNPHGRVGRKATRRVATESRSPGSPSPSMDRLGI